MKLKLLALLIIFAGVLYWQDSTSDAAMDKYISEYKQFQAQADSTSKFADSLAVEIVIAENEARAAKSRAEVYGRQVVSLKDETTSLKDRAHVLTETIADTLELAKHLLPVKDSIITTQETTIDTQDKQIQELYIALESKDTALTLAILRGDSLQIVVNNIPPAPKNPNTIFGMQLPSRKTSFIIGAAAGILMGVVIK
jgi:hypothetical protein